VHINELKGNAGRRVGSDTRDKMHLQLIGLAVADEVEMVRYVSRKGKPARRYLKARVVKIVEKVGRAVAVDSRSGDEIISLDMGHTILVDSAVDNQKAFAGAINDQTRRQHGTAAQSETDGRAGLTCLRQSGWR